MLTKLSAYANVILMLLLIAMYFKISNLNGKITERNIAIELLLQNERALLDDIDMKADSLQNYAIYVEDLQSKIIKMNNEYNILSSEYKIAIDSINVLNEPTIVDTSGNTIIITFQGKEGKVSYKGNTTYFKLTGEGVHSIDIGIDSTIITTRIYRDSSNILRSSVYADGNLITHAKTTIDSTVYTLLNAATHDTDHEMTTFTRLKALFELNQLIINKDGIWNADRFDFNVGLQYQLNDNLEIYGKKQLLNNGYEIGTKYTPTIKSLFDFIF